MPVSFGNGMNADQRVLNPAFALLHSAFHCEGGGPKGVVPPRPERLELDAPATSLVAVLPAAVHQVLLRDGLRELWSGWGAVGERVVLGRLVKPMHSTQPKHNNNTQQE